MTPAKSIVLMLLATALMLVVVWQKSERRRMSYRLDAVQREIVEHNARQSDLRAQIARLKSPERIRALVAPLSHPMHPAPAQCRPLNRSADPHRQTEHDPHEHTQP